MAAVRTLATAVTVLNPKTGLNELFLPGQDVPAWARKAITNPDAWVEAPAPARAPGGEKAAPNADKQGADEKTDEAEDVVPEGATGEGDSDESGDEHSDDDEKAPPTGVPLPDEKWTNQQIEEFADTHGISLKGAGVKVEMLDRISDHLAKNA